MKILTIVGARPQFVKAAALSREFSKHKNVEEILQAGPKNYQANLVFILSFEIETIQGIFL